MSKSSFSKQEENSRSPLPKFFAFVGRGTDPDINRIKEFIEKEAKVELYFQRRSQSYLRIVNADNPTEEEEK